MKQFGNWCFRLRDVNAVRIEEAEPLKVRVYFKDGPIVQFEGEEADRLMGGLVPNRKDEVDWGPERL